MKFQFYLYARRKGGRGKLLGSADAFKHCLNIMRWFYNGKTIFSCQRIVSGNIAKVAKSLCHTKPVTPFSNRGRFHSLKNASANFVFMRYA